jgi:hypothetical protein
MEDSRNIIAIRYTGGAGGQFLNGWLTQAKYQDYQDLPLGEFGSGHVCYRDIPFNVSSTYAMWDHLKIQQAKTPDREFIPPYFFGTHCETLDVVRQDLSRVITITYTPDDAWDISMSWLSKYILENPEQRREIERNVNPLGLTFEQQAQRQRERGLDPDRPTENWQMRDLQLRKAAKSQYYSTSPQDPNLLDISWRELMYGDPADLAQRLAQWLGWSPDRFHTHSLVEWRRATLEGWARARIIGGS